MKPNELNSLYAWTLMCFVNKGTYEEYEGKSDEFKSGFLTCVETLRDELIRLSSSD